MGKKGDIYQYIVTRSIGVVLCIGHMTVPKRISCYILLTGQYKGNVWQYTAIYGNIRQYKGNIRRLLYSASVKLCGAGGIR